MIQEVEVPEGKVLFPYFVDKENEDIAIECFASRVQVKYTKDEDGNDTDEEVYTAKERARIELSRRLSNTINKYRAKKAADAVEPIANIVV